MRSSLELELKLRVADLQLGKTCTSPRSVCPNWRYVQAEVQRYLSCQQAMSRPKLEL